VIAPHTQTTQGFDCNPEPPRSSTRDPHEYLRGNAIGLVGERALFNGAPELSTPATLPVQGSADRPSRCRWPDCVHYVVQAATYRLGKIYAVITRCYDRRFDHE